MTPNEWLDANISDNKASKTEEALRKVLSLHRKAWVHVHWDECSEPDNHEMGFCQPDEPFCLDEKLFPFCKGCADASGSTDWDMFDYPCPTRNAVVEALGLESEEGEAND